MLGIGGELSVFVSACLAGNLLCLSYEVLRILRRLIRHSLFFISMEDLLFGVASGLYLFTECYRTCSGVIRWYFVLGVLGGGLITLWVIQKIEKKCVDKIKKTR